MSMSDKMKDMSFYTQHVQDSPWEKMGDDHSRLRRGMIEIGQKARDICSDIDALLYGPPPAD